MKKKITWHWLLCFLFIAVVCLLPTDTVQAAVEYTYEFDSAKQAYYITDATVTPPENAIVLPTSYNGYPVIGLKGAAFSYEKYIKKIVIPSAYTTIEKGAFSSCRHLEEVEIKAQITTLHGGIFSNCRKLKKITLPDTLKKIETQAFFSCGVKEIVIPKSVTVIEKGAFFDCEELEKVVIKGKIKTLKGSTFNQCPNLKKLNLPNTLKKIETNAISYCGIETITLPASVTTVENAAIASCTNLYQVICKGKNTEFDGVFYGVPTNEVTVVAPKNSTTYTSAMLRRYVVTNSSKFKFRSNGKKMFVGEKKYLQVCNNPYEVEWKTSNASVVDVDESGCLTAKKKGTATITAKINGKKYKYKCTVVKRTEKNVLNIVYNNYVTKDMTDYEKVVAANMFLAQNMEYGRLFWGEEKKSDAIKNALTKGVGTCKGYAYTYKKILDHYGITNKIVKGSATERHLRSCSDHVWNMVKIGTRWYHVDVTWNDPIDKGLDWDYYWSRYLVVSNDKLDDDHKWSKKKYPIASKKAPDKKVTTKKK